MDRRVRIALSIGRAGYSPRQFRRGIRRVAEEHPDWLVREWSPTLDPQGEALRNWRPHGIIGRQETPLLASVAVEMAAGLVFLAGDPGSTNPGIRLWLDEWALGAAAAEHLLARGFENFGTLRAAGRDWIDQRQAGFEQAVRPHATTLSSYELAEQRLAQVSNIAWLQIDEGLAAWAHELPKPAAVFAVHDAMGRELLDACLREAIAVPESVAVIGAGDNVDICQTTHPPLSSVHVPWEPMGLLAARLLARRLDGQAQLPRETRVGPRGITERASTSLVAIDDPDLAEALYFVREHACDPIDVDAVARATAMGRRRLERGFRRLLGRTPHQQIRRVQMDRARRLLARTDLPIGEIAERVGISRSHFTKVFHDELGLTPAAFRAEHGR